MEFQIWSLFPDRKGVARRYKLESKISVKEKNNNKDKTKIEKNKKQKTNVK